MPVGSLCRCRTWQTVAAKDRRTPAAYLACRTLNSRPGPSDCAMGDWGVRYKLWTLGKVRQCPKLEDEKAYSIVLSMVSWTRQKSLSTSVRALYDIYLIQLKSNICSISSLCLMCLVPSRELTPGPLASGNMGATCCRCRTSRSRIWNAYTFLLAHATWTYRIRLSAVCTHNL